MSDLAMAMQMYLHLPRHEWRTWAILFQGKSLYGRSRRELIRGILNFILAGFTDLSIDVMAAGHGTKCAKEAQAVTSKAYKELRACGPVLLSSLEKVYNKSGNLPLSIGANKKLVHHSRRKGMERINDNIYSHGSSTCSLGLEDWKMDG